MTAGADRWIRWTTIASVALLALIAGTVSYLHMHELVAWHGPAARGPGRDSGQCARDRLIQPAAAAGAGPDPLSPRRLPLRSAQEVTVWALNSDDA
jgi:hypothetical protein